MNRFLGFLALLLAFVALAAPAVAQETPRVRIGSKAFTESVVLGEIARLMAEHAGADAHHQRELGGSPILFTALESGEIDVYPEYTGTLRLELLADLNLQSDDELEASLAERGIGMIGPLGFNNTYAIGLTRERAAELGVRTISDLRDHPNLAFGFNHEFLVRRDGWPALKAAYNLPQTNVRGVEHEVAYRGLVAGQLDAMELYSTDAEIEQYGLTVLDDDRGFFPQYDAVLLYRLDLEERAPRVVEALRQLTGSLNEQRMSELNLLAKVGRPPGGNPDAPPVRMQESAVAAEFVSSAFGFDTDGGGSSGLPARLWQTTKGHLLLVGFSMAFAMIIGLPLGVVAAKFRTLGAGTLTIVGIVQTIPSLALLALLVGVPGLGLGDDTAIVALTAYSLLPIVRNTHAGLTAVRGDLIESAHALGLSSSETLIHVELPLAAGAIAAGVKTAAVINIGTATLGSLVGAGGYGVPIITGLRIGGPAGFELILEGVIPAALLAIAAQAVLGGVERLLVPRGVRPNR